MISPESRRASSMPTALFPAAVGPVRNQHSATWEKVTSWSLGGAGTLKVELRAGRRSKALSRGPYPGLPLMGRGLKWTLRFPRKASS